MKDPVFSEISHWPLNFNYEDPKGRSRASDIEVKGMSPGVIDNYQDLPNSWSSPVGQPTILPDKPITEPSIPDTVVIPDKIPGPDDPMWAPFRGPEEQPAEEVPKKEEPEVEPETEEGEPPKEKPPSGPKRGTDASL